MLRLLIADEIDLSGIELLPRSKFRIIADFGISNDEILKKHNDADVLVIRSIRKIGRDFLSSSSLKMIAICAKGTDNVDVEYARKCGIKVINAETGNSISAAEHTIGMIIAISRQILLSDRLVRENRFGFYDYERHEIYGKSIGVIGYGKVGSYVGKLCKSFGMKVYGNDTDKGVRLRHKNVEFKSVNFIFRKCDYVTIHIPLNRKNFHFISKEKLKLLRNNSVLINTSRGDVIDEKFLYWMLLKGKIRFAGLDVFSGEPFINRAFAKLDNVLLTNHIAGKTIESRRRISQNIFLEIASSFS